MSDNGNDIAGAMTGVVVRYVRNLLGERGVEELLATAGETRSASELEDTTRWSSYQQGVALFEAAAAVTGDPTVARAVGEETLRQYAGSDVAALLRSMGSPGRLLESITETAAKFSSVTQFEAMDVGEGSAVIAAASVAGFGRHPTMCAYTTGLLSQAPVLFGLAPAVVLERACQARGDDRCVYEVSWSGTGDELADPARRADQLEAQVGAMTVRLESLYSTVTELLSVDDLSTVLARITDRAATSVRAPRYVLAVRLSEPGPAEIHHYGMTDEEAHDAARLLLDSEVGSFPEGWLVADVTSGRRQYGRLAAVLPDHSRFFPQERRTLAVYATYAAAVLDMATALEESKRRDATARALLDLGRSLSTVTTTEEVCRQLVATVPDVAGCERAVVLLWEPDECRFRAAVNSGFTADIEPLIERLSVRVGDTPYAAAMVDAPSPLTLDPGCDDPYIADLLQETRSGSVAIMPLVAHDELFGVVCAGRDEGRTWSLDQHDLIERLSGLAAQASTALSNARLLERMRLEAWHDTLTGLPNRRYLEAEADRAVANGLRHGHRVAVLFADLDKFKEVNDTLGHAAGDELLRQAAHRLQGCVRVGDMVARLSGDEFVVLAESVASRTEAAALAERLRLSFGPLFELAGHLVEMSATVGVAVTPEDGATYQDLLRSADGAMYRTKVGRLSPTS